MTHPAIASGRLALYLAACRRASKAWISSDEIARMTGVNASQVRRDVTDVLGSVGKRGFGFDAARLANRIEATLVEHVGELEVLVAAAQERASQLADALAHVEAARVAQRAADRS